MIPNSSQQLFNAFGNSAPHLTQNLVQSAPASASQQLFDAFSSPSPPSQQSQKNVKDSILSLYGKQQQKSNLQQNTATFVEFAAFQESSNDRKPKPFDPFESIEGQSGANTNSKYGVFDSAAKPQPATQRNPAIFGTTVFTSQPSSPTKIASFVPQQNTSNSVGLQAVSSPIVSPSKEIFDAFASIPENESGQLTGISSDFGLLNVQPSLTNNENKVNARTQPLDDFGDFAQSSLPVADFQPFNQSKPLTAGPAAQDGWAGWGDQGKGNNFPQGPIVTNSALSTSPMQNMPASSRNTSNILEQLDLSPKKPMSFDTLPPVEDGWSGFQ